ncbi:MAG TPA: hypothetical protein VLA24_11780 [Pseudomonadales bacterium]|nr:hypothetical protein [Pseudomonadales bacterium]
MNMMNKYAANPFFNVALLGEEAEGLVDADALDGGLNQEKFKALKVVFTEIRSFAGEERCDERLLYVQAPPFKGWNKEALFEALDKFLAKCKSDIDLDCLQIYLGTQRIARPAPIYAKVS